MFKVVHWELLTKLPCPYIYCKHDKGSSVKCKCKILLGIRPILLQAQVSRWDTLALVQKIQKNFKHCVWWIQETRLNVTNPGFYSPVLRIRIHWIRNILPSWIWIRIRKNVWISGSKWEKISAKTCLKNFSVFKPKP